MSRERLLVATTVQRALLYISFTTSFAALVTVVVYVLSLGWKMRECVVDREMTED